MTTERESRTFRVGQEVEVSYRARVAEVAAGGAEGSPILRLEPLNGSYHSPPGGWVDPEVVTVDLVKDSLPDRPGIYWAAVRKPEDQAHMGDYHADGKEFYYLNTAGNWVDIGWGQPHVDDLPLVGPLVEVPF